MTVIWWHNIPLFGIILCLLSAAVSSVLKRGPARILSLTLMTLQTAFSGVLIYFTAPLETPVHFMMGHFPAPWGNEIRFGLLEAITATVFSLIFLMSLLGGGHRMQKQLDNEKENLYYVVCDLLEAALLAQVYTNDLFTAYVFVEIMTLAACSLITARTKGHTLVAAMRYMILNLVGSGLFLLGIVLLYNLTGHLLMEDIRRVVDVLVVSGEYRVQLFVIIGLLTVGLAIKSALFPFHTWVPDAYANGTPSSGAILSSLVSKGYIFLLLKIFCRVLGPEAISASRINVILLLLSAGGILMGSIDAIHTKHIKRMVAFSSVAQIGYIYLGIALGTPEGYVAAMWQLLIHGIAKSMLFLSVDVLRKVSGHEHGFEPFRGSGYRAPLAGLAFTVGAFSMVGLPLTGGFITKMTLLSSAASASLPVTIAVYALLIASTLLNILYFLKSVLLIYAPGEGAPSTGPARAGFGFVISASILSLLTLVAFFAADPVLRGLLQGLSQFS